MDYQPLVSVISVNYKQTEVTAMLLDSLREITYKNIEIIIVDNGSGQNLERFLSLTYPEVKIVLSEDNLGFAGGNNLGIRMAKGKYCLFLNNDTEVAPDFLEPIIQELEQNPNIGIASPKIIYFNSGGLIQYAGSDGIGKLTGRGSKTGHLLKDEGQFSYVKETKLAHGAAMAVPFEVIKKVGMLPELFFLYYEEHDWCEMIKRAGFKVFYIGTSTIFHKESVSVGRQSTLKTYYMARNRLLFMRRNTQGIEFLVSLLFFIFLAIPNNTIKYLIKLQFKHLASFYAGIGWNLSHYNIFTVQKLN